MRRDGEHFWTGRVDNMFDGRALGPEETHEETHEIRWRPLSDLLEEWRTAPSNTASAGCSHPSKCTSEGCHGCDEPLTRRIARFERCTREQIEACTYPFPMFKVDL